MEKEKKEKPVVIVYDDWMRYELGADFWRIAFCLLTTKNIKHKLRLKSIKVNGIETIYSAKISLTDVLPINMVKGLFTEQILRWDSLKSMGKKYNLSKSEIEEFFRLSELIIKGVENLEIIEVYLFPNKFPLSITNRETYSVDFEIQDGIYFKTEVYVMSLPLYSGWAPAELQCHSRNFSDGNLSLRNLRDIYKNKGYKILYMTDHVNQIKNKGGWQEYRESLISYSNEHIGLYPGMEMSVKKKGECDIIFSDLLAYGIKDLEGFENKKYNHQRGIDCINANAPGISSCSIAHPYSYKIPWRDWGVIGYRGMELMSGIQFDFSDFSPPMVRWRQEIDRLLNFTFETGCFASARTGGDFHGYLDVNPPGYVTYIRCYDWSEKYLVDEALYKGYTVASRFGGLGFINIKYNGLEGGVGDIIKGVSTNEIIGLDITFIPVKTGRYTITVYRDNKLETVFSISDSYTAGQTYKMKTNYKFPGGKHYYFLYISGEDYVYSSPIFISN